ncbi:hypothetical protein [Dietzia sp. B32]|uniref:hypothetical protein n=1 Tax=Dietzia sp. B32 TaxID=2915130 RepID=UPI0021ADFD1D|nr:hypothetical protein [Dietzia sp. B32]UVE96745.1 hypothetical protein L8M95_08290 [Dietzia sp. B32]
MRSQRPRPAHGRRFAPGFVALAAVVTVAGCSGAGPESDPGPPRLTPNPQHEIAAGMVGGRPAPEARLNACGLLELTTEEVIELTGADMPEVDPTGSGDLGLLCTYGGPGSPERYEAARAEVDSTDSSAPEATATADGTDTDTDTSTDASITPSTTPTITQSITPPAFDPDIVPDTFAAGVVTPRGGAGAALAGQATLLGVRYACSEIRGSEGAEPGSAGPGAPEAPAIVEPQPDTMYIDCAAAPAGGGVEVHTILVSGDELWHITLLKPETPRSPEAEATALAGLHRVADEIIARA